MAEYSFPKNILSVFRQSDYDFDEKAVTVGDLKYYGTGT